MIAFLKAFALNTWYMVAEMAPYLIFGFAIAGLLHVLIRKEQVQRLLGKPGLGAVFKACLIGVPMPLCSCSVYQSPPPCTKAVRAAEPPPRFLAPPHKLASIAC